MDRKADLYLKYKTDLNAIAELGWQEKKTTKYIAQKLKDRPLVKGFGRQKVGLMFKIGRGERSILLRADIDALKTQDGPRHICGHSTHTAALMAVYHDARRKEHELIRANRSVYFLFQPAEETWPSGAMTVLDECPDLIDRVDFAFAAHVRPLMPQGTIGLANGQVMARGDYMEVEISGRMVHVKEALKGVDALEAASYLVLAVKELLRANRDRLRINFGVLEGGLQANAVADRAILKGDIRLRDEAGQAEVKKLMERIIRRTEEKTNARIKMRYYSGVPVLENDQALAGDIARYLARHHGAKVIRSSALFSYGCEDFSFISSRIPSVYALVGTGDKYDIHQEKCTISDRGTMNVYQYFSGILDWWRSPASFDPEK